MVNESIRSQWLTPKESTGFVISCVNEEIWKTSKDLVGAWTTKDNVIAFPYHSVPS